MTKSVKIGIGVGVILLYAGVAYFFIKKKNTPASRVYGAMVAHELAQPELIKSKQIAQSTTPQKSTVIQGFQNLGTV